MCDLGNPDNEPTDLKRRFTLHRKNTGTASHWLFADNYTYDPSCWWCQVKFVLFGWTGA